ncbi:MAG: cupin-like domain-containing protein [Gammaproteobacteria bacterium]
MNALAKIQEWHDVDANQFHNEIAPLNQPAVLRSLVSNWPMVAAAAKSDHETAEYLKSFDTNNPLYTIVGQPDINGRFFYSDDLSGTNFQRTQATLTTVLDNLLALRGSRNPHAIAIQATPIRDALPGFDQHNTLPLLPESVAPSLWLGNKAAVAPHFDVHDNVACVVAGKRTFTLFPPDQIANLYVGPTLNAPGGVPISMVDLKQPDLERFPKFTEAIAVAQQATLYPGDAIFIPTPWWHAVESLEKINVLVNYWWGRLTESTLSPNHSLLHGMLTIAKLNHAQRESWRHFFDYFVFRTSGDPTAHLPPDLDDIVTNLTPEQRSSVYALLKDRLE